MNSNHNLCLFKNSLRLLKNNFEVGRVVIDAVLDGELEMS